MTHHQKHDGHCGCSHDGHCGCSHDGHCGCSHEEHTKHHHHEEKKHDCGCDHKKHTHNDTTEPARVAELTEALARAQADMANMHKRMERDKSESYAYAVVKISQKLLPALDNLERALANMPADLKENTWAQGISAIRQTFVKGLETLDIRPFVAQGEAFDEHRHEAIAHVAGAEGVVISEIEKGYIFGEKILRHAKVAIGNGESA